VKPLLDTAAPPNSTGVYMFKVFSKALTKAAAHTMCLSACAFGWLKASKRINRGVVGFHLPYDPKTNETTMGMQLVARNFMFERGYLMLWNELAETTPSDFVFMKADSTWSGNWREAHGNLKVTSDPRSLKRC